ncbi:alpha-glucosidase (family GH31 glycosyl hydrolase) [Motilibacter peucedani]|uniref:Alpha-glucosidase (Family GH31 glycosyl hydrolase) n=1 Tax=Motilibacter peucedani TaxID=598650 RepID=A0A420XNS9_9ACTN|nr:TIM-barrel domain-containing protein [Motilibacter peucedani]RKS73863.1 alpha-glucosidase (family GH31 glycosyl hydrolase) [Motilibacter peucedani]
MLYPRNPRHRRRVTLLATAAAASAALVALPSAADAAPVPAAAKSAVVSGQARFEVLSPTLVRTEYAGDSRFVDAATFNAIGRDAFAKTSFTTTQRDGWLQIDTAAMSLRYRVGSGSFSSDNLVVRLKAGAQDVEGRPWVVSDVAPCAAGALCEAEDLTLNGVGVATDHGGFTGSGFAAGFEGTGNSLSFTVDAAAAATYSLDLRYADGLAEARTLSLSVDGGAARQVTLPSTGSWDTWSVLPLDLALTAGHHTVALTRGAADTGQLNIDSLAVLPQGATYPEPQAVCAWASLCEAEALGLHGRMHLATDHGGYTGKGFAAGFEGVGDDITFTVTAPSAGDYELTARYANGFGTPGDVSLAVDGGATTRLALPPSGSWDTWALATASLHLSAGANRVHVVRQASDPGNVNIDSLAVGPVGTGLPAPRATNGVDCSFGATCEAESVGLAGGARVAKDHNGWSGKGFVSGLDARGAATTVHVVGVPRAGTYALQLRYAANAGATSASVVAPGGTSSTLALPATSSWDSWRTVSTPVTLPAGASDVALACPADGGCLANIDTVAVVAQGSPLLAPHAPLGGYRRGLDGFNGDSTHGNPTLSPGILYQDGWSLLDDTTSAVYDTASRKVTQRSAHAGGYQDGYVFGYGQQYTKALGDLATLTGPSKLLPRWTYGVWFSEYLDRTAADYQSLVQKFRSESVPLDVLVVDTDFKALNDWDGWEIDRSKFPDPEAFFAWAKSQGLKTTLNVHPEIAETDPQFPAAMATAKGKLARQTSCNGGAPVCYTFDFGDPDQLKAFFGLHDQMNSQGTDFWWLDWCCDPSESNLAGVTGDAWINQQYADYTAPHVGRGFAFSRAFGSLQAGGYGNPQPVPTGPWADKRTTLPFTGDTTSTWGTLAAEVGFTSGESASTGLSPVSHDIGGHNGGQYGIPGSDVVDGSRTDKLPDDLYARWVQFGTFQPIDRLHSNHGDRLPWQYPGAAGASANEFLNLREALVPYTYTLAQQAEATGVPVVRPTYLDHPGEQEAYATAGSEYLYGPDVLVAPVTTPGTTATTRVWFPSGSSWTDWFTGKTYAGGTSADVTTGLDTMPVFVKAGGIVATRTGSVTNDLQNPLTAVTLTVAPGAKATTTLFEDDGTTNDRKQSSTTEFRYSESAHHGTLQVRPVDGSFPGQVTSRAWTVRFLDADKPASVTVDGVAVPASAWTWDAQTRALTVTTAARPTSSRLDVSYR